MTSTSFSLAEVLAVAKLHPFYNLQIKYPPSGSHLSAAREQASRCPGTATLRSQPLLHKRDMYKVIERLVHDVSPGNTYRHSSYMSITGGGSGGIPMMFATDVHENRRQREAMGNFLRTSRVVDPGDVVLSTHLSGGFYRSLDLATEIMENAGATVISAGHNMAHDDVVQALVNYHINVLTGDGSQCIRIVHRLAQLPQDERERIRLTKIIYTSESLTGPQQELIRSTLGDIKVCSIMGSSEAGPWSVSNPEVTGDSGTCSVVDFLFDTRNMVIEILSPRVLEEDSLSMITPLAEGEEGIIVQTSLQKLRNPLVRYITGDVGSLHSLPEKSRASVDDSEYLRVLRMRGRDKRFSFKWYASYFEFDKLDEVMNAKDGGILQWQVILDQLPGSTECGLELRLLRAPSCTGIISDEEVGKRMEELFLILDENRDLFRLVFVDDLSRFERSSTAGKVIKFIDRTH